MKFTAFNLFRCQNLIFWQIFVLMKMQQIGECAVLRFEIRDFLVFTIEVLELDIFSRFSNLYVDAWDIPNLMILRPSQMKDPDHEISRISRFFDPKRNETF